MKLGVNFFGPKGRLYHDFTGTVERLKRAGLTEAEICVAFDGGGEPPAELKLVIPPEVMAEMSGGIWPVEEAPRKIAAVRELGMTVSSAHIMLGTVSGPEQLTAMKDTLVAFGRENGLRYYVISLMKGAAAMAPFVPAVEELARALAEAGIALAYHNHEMECEPADGVTALELLMEGCPSLMLELDVGWAQFAGVDPAALIEKYGHRLVLLHFKDVTADACQANRATCFTVVGEGAVPLAAVVAAALQWAPRCEAFIIDQDDSQGDILDDLAAGAANIRSAID